MFQIQTLNKISPLGLAQLDEQKYHVSGTCQNPDGILVRSADMLQAEFAPNLLAIARAGAGTNNIPSDRCSEAGIVVFNTPGANANAVKELLICSLILASRDIVGGIQWANTLTDGDDDVVTQVEKGKSAFVGPEVLGKTLGVIGLGAVGVLAANAAVRLGMTVYGYDPYLSVNNALQLDGSVRVADLKTIYAQSDYITIHVPLMDSTRNTINESAIAAMKHGVRILNLARGGLVDEDDVLAALEQGKVERYITDFPSGKLVGKKGVVCIPHLGASTPESEENCAVMAAQQLADYLETGNIRNSVNLPNCELARSGDVRLCIVNRNVPNMLSQILAVLSADGANVDNMVNRSRGDYAYTIIDCTGALPPKALEDIKAIEGILRLRVIQ